jgi:hypothetical protein
MAVKWKLLVTNPTGTARRRFPVKQVTNFTATITRYGCFADFTISTSVRFDDPSFSAIQDGDRVEAFANGVRLYRGYVTTRAPIEDDPLQRLAISGQGMQYFARKQLADQVYPYPGDGADISQPFSDIAHDWIIDPGILGIGGEPVAVDVQALRVGVLTDNVDARLKVTGDVFDDLTSQSGNLATWGVDVNPAGQNRLFIRPIDDVTSTPRHVISIPSKKVSRAQSEHRSDDVVNVLLVEGGDPRYPQLLANGNFKNPVVYQEGGSNIIPNGDFETQTDWTHSGTGGNTADYKQTDYNGTYKGEPYSGQWQMEFDNVGEYIEQTGSFAFVAGHNYTLSVRARKEADLSTTIGSGYLELRDVSNTVIQTINLDITPTSNSAWDYFSVTFQPGSGAVSWKFHAQLDTLSAGGMMLDSVTLYDADVLYQDSWQVRVYDSNGGSPHFNRVNWVYQDTSHSGKYCVLIDVTSNDADGQDAHLEPLGAQPFQVKGEQSIRFGMWYRSPIGASANTPKIDLYLKFNAADGHMTNEVKTIIASSSPVSSWTYVESIGTAHGDSTTCTAQIIFRGSGQMLIDDVSCRDAAVGGGTSYLETGPLRHVYKVTDSELGFTSPIVNSIADYGVRADILQEGDATTIDILAQIAKAYFKVSALPKTKPTLTLVDDTTIYLPGQSVSLQGHDGTKLSGGQTLTIASVKISYDGMLEQSLELGEELEDPVVVIKQIIRDEQRRLGSNSGSGSGASSGSSSGGGVTSSSGNVLIDGTDTTPAPLASKIVNGVGTTVVVNGSPGNETLQLNTPVIVDNETPTGAINSSNTAYTLAHSPLAGSVAVYLGATATTLNRLAETAFSVTGTTLTMGTAPATGSILRVSYRY